MSQARIDVFNGDADGLCALQQLRLAEQPQPTDPPPRLVTGIKRHIRLLEGLEAPPGARVTVLDVGFADNRADVERLLAAGCTVRYFDHHHAGEVPPHPALETHLTASPDLCTSLLVDRVLGSRDPAHRTWAVAGAFGDNMAPSARRLAGNLGLNPDEVAALQELGELLNYNGYGDTIADLHFHPARLFETLHPFADARVFAREAQELATLRAGFAEDHAMAAGTPFVLDESWGRVLLLPDAPWARRIQGVLANRLTHEAPEAAHGVAVMTGSGDLRISVRAPLSRPQGAGALCRGFPSGGGRAGAGGINALPRAGFDRFLAAFRVAFGGSTD